jgi:hypothetical protein
MSSDQPPPRDTERITLRDRRAHRATPLKPRPAAGASSIWALQCHVDGQAGMQRTMLAPLPFRIGRA